MVNPARPNSSYNNVRLTRANFNGQSLHSKFRNQENSEPPPKPEPATDDEPLSSSEEEQSNAVASDEEIGDVSKFQAPRPTLEEKLASSAQDDGQSSRTPRSKKGRNGARGSGSTRKRTLNNTTDGNDDDDDGDDNLFSDMFRSSQGPKRFKAADYGRNRNSGVYSRTPSSSMTPVQMGSSPPSSRRRPKSATTTPTAKSSQKKQEKASQSDGFKVPLDIDKARNSPTFKAPPPFPNDLISSSSLAPSSARDPPIFDVDDNDISSPSSSLSSALSYDLQDLSDVEKDMLDDVHDTSITKQALCPWCKGPVDPELLLRFQSQPNQRIREQQRFCDSHKDSTAEKEWQNKGYPEIDWSKFDDRIRRHFVDLEGILVPDSHSYYRNLLDSALKAGKAKNFRLSLEGDGLETISCGYYGTKGAGKMLQALTERFSRKLRRLAVDDHIVKTAGVVGYAQAVLVPELAVRLVKEDMAVSDDVARQILRESIDIGEKLNPAQNDVVPIPEDGKENHSLEPKDASISV
ncbi:RTC4-like domain-containing protein [Aspergillus avenaceus]|uniref:Restriction of telomere capping protein 4 n=1 Tax=Aspergillus avenaceus TaxID=36643 RepID=A0A5N6TZV0_ASPAV|nr:RTC4-like domain-containing protein [Aspergillus avenaceus]